MLGDRYRIPVATDNKPTKSRSRRPIQYIQVENISSHRTAHSSASWKGGEGGRPERSESESKNLLSRPSFRASPSESGDEGGRVGPGLPVRPQREGQGRARAGVGMSPAPMLL
ncbi:hypothetical protein MPTK1_3g07110 [Marchantia polymorpha subsp. ruderalis]|uniref:Uncharacterized protein n=2 Tax=Marchantia polymorpha TaxID=3197 RepID=A0AAF6AY84_MARPO|nr:hypothetical protein MARPO_0006s0184 [Marchantia polymorpha]BBN04718.1 hypothetical protein Mp_3g07110 [Marchantia polymorpha subsp. ruderalis]|eukprot:PTQ48161.1 hypothetical protein MARPO_0006s0184 [Marchantia polymorpha]